MCLRLSRLVPRKMVDLFLPSLASLLTAEFYENFRKYDMK